MVRREGEELGSAGAQPEESRETLQAFIDSVPDFVVRTDLDGRMLYLNRLAPGITMAEAIGGTLFDFTDPAYHAVARETLARVKATLAPASYESVGAGADRTPRNYLTRVGPLVRAGQLVGFSVVATDVTSLKAAARALDEREHQLRLATEAADVGLWVWDARDDTVLWDETCRRHFGVGPEHRETTYAGFLERVHVLDRDRIRAEVDESLARGRYRGLQFRTTAPSGEQRWLMTAGDVRRGDDGRVVGLTGCLLDVTERRRREESTLQTQRLEAVGQLAAGVAHNFNNLLAAILPAIELTARRFPQSAALLGDVREAAERSADVVRQLVAFAGGAARTAGPARPNEVVSIARRVVQLSRAIVVRQVEIELETEGDTALALIDAGELEHALLNLVLNARDSFDVDGPRGEGLPRIRVVVGHAPESSEPGRAGSVRVSVIDNGPGMTEEVRRRALEPFFTTKPPGRGTGLGLSSVYATVRGSGGSLELDSVPGVGTGVHLHLRGAQLGSAQGSAQPSAGAAPAGGRGERLLVVDDDESVRRAVTTVLRAGGYVVDEFGRPREALARFAEAPGAYALVLLDESMPDLSGTELLAALLALSPSSRVVSFSGFDKPLAGARAHLAKPVSIDRLLACVRAVLDE